MRGKQQLTINDHLSSFPFAVVHVEQGNVSWSTSPPISVTLSTLNASQKRFFIADRYIGSRPCFADGIAISYWETEPGDPKVSLVLKPGGVAGWLFSRDSTAFKFVLILENFGPRIGTRILTSPQTDTPDYLARFFDRHIPHDSPDRLSERLDSGQSVSVIIRRVFEDGKAKNLVDITFRDDGVLEWPSLESRDIPEESGTNFPIRNAESL